MRKDLEQPLLLIFEGGLFTSALIFFLKNRKSKLAADKVLEFMEKASIFSPSLLKQVMNSFHPKIYLDSISNLSTQNIADSS